jgi:mevalonate kinase
MVEKVADLKKKNPEICDPILDAIGASRCVESAISLIPTMLGTLMT